MDLRALLYGAYERRLATALSADRVPKHVGVILDGNRRWARAAGIGCIGLETGGFSRHELTEDGAVAVYRDVAELATQLRTSPIGHLVDGR